MSYVWPIKGPITQGFGRPALRVEPTMFLERDAEGWKRCKPTSFPGATWFTDVHPGIDIQCAVGTPVLAPADGKVVRTTTYRIFNPLTGSYVYGHYIQFVFGTLMLHVDHLSKFVVAEGKAAKKGQVIARTGNSGVSTGPHAHMEIRRATDPSASWSGFRLNPERALK